MAKVLVSGGSGFLGSHIADALCAEGHQVVVFDVRPSPFLKNGQTMALGDITKPRDIEAAIQDCAYVYHLAGLADLNEGRTRPAETVAKNIAGTVNMLEAARRAAAQRFLFASTVYVYSREGGFYRCSKQACESYIEEYFRQYSLPFTILRFGCLYGPRADEKNGVYRLLKMAVEGKHIRHEGTADDTREYIHVEDAARLSVAALDPQYANQHLTITGHFPMRLRDLFTMFSEILGKKIDVEYVLDGEREGHYRITPYSYTPRIGKKMTSPVYVDMGQGLLQLVEQISAGAKPPAG